MIDELLARGFQATPIGTLPADWQCIQLRYIVPESRKVTYGIVQPGEHDSQGVLLIRGQDYIKGWAEPDAFFRVARPLHNVFKRSLTVAGDLLICIVGATTGATNVVPSWISEANITQTTARVACDSRKADSHFVLYALASELGQLQVRKYVKGSAQPGLNLADVERFYVPAAPLSEQRKIARILTTVDNLIEKTEALIAKYQAIKQGMMHDLFTRGVDSRGHLRPPYEQAPELYKQSELGWISKDWDCLSFGNFIVAGPQNGLYKPISSYSVDGSPIVRIDGFYDGQLCDTKSFRRLHLTRAELAVYILEADDILVNRVNSIDYVGKSAIVPELQEATVFESNIMRLKVNRERLLPDFAIRLLCHYTTQHQFHQSAKSAVAQASINQSDIRRCVVAIPRMKEQVSLVERCRSIDRQVDCEKTYLVKLRLQKTGLMQDLLIGKVRVKVDEAEEVAAHA